SAVPASATIPELSPYTFTATATDSDLPAQTLTFSLVGAPTGATIDGSTGAFSWTPTEGNAAPAIANVPASATIPELSPYTFTATATDADVPAQTLTFSLVGAPA